MKLKLTILIAGFLLHAAVQSTYAYFVDQSWHKCWGEYVDAPDKFEWIDIESCTVDHMGMLDYLKYPSAYVGYYTGGGRDIMFPR